MRCYKRKARIIFKIGIFWASKSIAMTKITMQCCISWWDVSCSATITVVLLLPVKLTVQMFWMQIDINKCIISSLSCFVWLVTQQSMAHWMSYHWFLVSHPFLHSKCLLSCFEIKNLNIECSLGQTFRQSSWPFEPFNECSANCTWS